MTKTQQIAVLILELPMRDALEMAHGIHRAPDTLDPRMADAPSAETPIGLMLLLNAWARHASTSGRRE